MWKSKVVIIDYGSGNLQSVFNALELVKNSSHLIQISSNPADLISATCIILPGVGAFGDCISSLKAIDGMVEELQTQVLTLYNLIPQSMNPLKNLYKMDMQLLQKHMID